MLLITPISPNFKGLKCSVFGRFRALQSRKNYGAMTLEAGKIALDAARCTGCGMCEAICPENALELRW